MVSVVARRSAWFGRVLSKEATILEPSTSCGSMFFGSRRAISLSNTDRHAGYYALYVRFTLTMMFIFFPF